MDTFEDSIIVTDTGRLAVVALGVVIGAIFGSFMNVVVYRLPLQAEPDPPGLALSVTASIRSAGTTTCRSWAGSCWADGAAIASAPISARYPAVEALVAVVSGLLAWKEGTIRIVTPQGYTGAWYEIDLAWYGFHLLLMCALDLRRADRIRRPRGAARADSLADRAGAGAMLL